MDYRHELKFLVSEAQLMVLSYKLRPFMQMDEHQQGDSYAIRSLYFDDLRDSCMWENEDGIDNRRKFRIRLYDGKSDVIHLEKKMKVRGMTKKISAALSKEDTMTYLKAGMAPELEIVSSNLQRELYIEIKTGGMMPKSIVEYNRTAFVERAGNVRITFDRNISACSEVKDFLKPTICLVPLLPKGYHVLEVKYDEFLPEYLAEVLEIGSLQQTSFSKYYLSRQPIQEVYTF